MILPIFYRDFLTALNICFLAPTRVCSPYMACWLVQPCLKGSAVWRTDRRTDG